MCGSHYAGWYQRTLRPLLPPKPACSVVDCVAAVYAKDLCHAHYQRERRGSLAAVEVQRPAKVAKPPLAERRRAWRSSAASRAGYHRRAALRRYQHATGTATDEFVALVLGESMRCGLCLGPLGEDRSVDHIVPLARGGRHDVGNIQILHSRCNSIKSDRLIPPALGPF